MRTPDDVATWYRDLDKTDVVWSHNGGGYDFLLLIEACGPSLRWQARMAGSAIISCRAVGGYAECRDSMRLFPGSLASWTGQKEDLELPCVCGDECGGYCSIRPRMKSSHRRRMIDYCDNDCLALLRALKADVGRLQDEGFDVIGARGTPRLTFGAVAWNTAARMAGIDPKESHDDWKDYDAGKRGYFGGRTEVGQISLSDTRWHDDRSGRATVGHRHDANSMYPWALTMAVPHGRRRRLSPLQAGRAYRDDAPGIYQAIVDLPEHSLPLLPHRYLPTKAHGRLTPQRLVWATGRVLGHWTGAELQAAERHGAKISRFLTSCEWEDFDPLYRPYVDHVWALRSDAQSRGDKRWAGMLKWYANALTGKLAQHPEHSIIRVISDAEPEPMELDARGVGVWSHVAGRVWARSMRRLSANCRPVQAAYLTSRARVLLLDRLMPHLDSWLYCDTDSTYLTNYDPTNEGKDLGQWKYEGGLTSWRALAPKLYRFLDTDGAPHVRARGVPMPRTRDTMSDTARERVYAAMWQTLDTLASGETLTRPGGVERLRRGGGRFVRRQVSRTHHDAHAEDCPARRGRECQCGLAMTRCGTRHVLPSGRTRPLHRTADGRYL